MRGRRAGVPASPERRVCLLRVGLPGPWPITLAVVEGKLTVTRVAQGVSDVPPGDVITRFGKKSAEEGA